MRNLAEDVVSDTELYNVFFTPLDNGRYSCRLCPPDHTGFSKGSGIYNFGNHVRRIHKKEYLGEVMESRRRIQAGDGQLLLDRWLDTHEELRNYYCWLQFVICANVPLSSVEDPRYTNFVLKWKKSPEPPS
jgi:hypothetical protein